MPPPPKARLHNRTGKLKNINKSNNNSPRNNVNTSQSGPIASTSASTSTETGSPSSAESNIQQFELELCWCIQTLEKTLESPTISAKVGKALSIHTKKDVLLIKFISNSSRHRENIENIKK